MQQITSYIYDNTISVLFDLDPSIVQRNQVVYARTLQLNQGVDNVLKIKVLNNDQKPVNVSGYTLTFNIVDEYVYSNANVLLSSNVVMSNANIGLGTVTITSVDLVQLDRGRYNYNVKVNTGSANIAAYVDDNYGASGQVQISNSAYPTNTITSMDLGQVSDRTTSAIYDFGTL